MTGVSGIRPVPGTVSPDTSGLGSQPTIHFQARVLHLTGRDRRRTLGPLALRPVKQGEDNIASTLNLGLSKICWGKNCPAYFLHPRRCCLGDKQAATFLLVP